MENRRPVQAAIEGSCLFGRLSGHGVYAYNLIKYLSVIEKVDRFVVWYSHPPLFAKSSIDFKQHNLKEGNSFMPHFLKPRPDVYHDTCLALPGPAVSSPRLCTIHDLAPLMAANICSDHQKKLFEVTVRDLLKRCCAVITPSESTRRDLVSVFGIDAARIHVISEGAAEAFNPRPSSEAGLARSRYSIKRPYVFFHGSIEERKNITRLLEAYSVLKYESPPDLVIAGSQGWLKEPFAKTVKRLGIEGQVKYLGYVPGKDLPCLLSGAEAFVWPSLYEGFGLPVLEAMACGTPVITSKTSSLPEVAGDAAVLVDPYNNDAIAAALRQVLSDGALRASLSKKGIERAKTFSLRTMAAKTLELYLKAAAN